MRKIAVTGGIASGKSTVCQILKEYGAYVVSADEIVHRLLSPETDLGRKIIALLGQDVVVNGVFNHRAIADKVFSNRPLLLQFEGLIHPEVKRIIEAEYQNVSHKESEYRFFVADVPLLFEGHFENDYDTILLVITDETICKERFMKSHSLNEYERRSKRFMPTTEKIKKSDFTIQNNGSLNDLKKNLNQIIPQLI